MTPLEPLTHYGPIENIVLLGGGPLLRSLCLWATSEGTPLKVITAPRHAHQTVDGQTLLELLRHQQIPHLVISNMEDTSVIDFLGDTTRSFCLSIGAAWIFKQQPIKSLFDNKLFNLHGTRLPRNRGGGAFSWQILMGDRFGFCVLHRVDFGVDTGDIIAFEQFLYSPSCRKPIDYERVYIAKNLHFVVEFIAKYRVSSLSLTCIRQSEYFSTYWPRLHTDLNGWIDWSMDSVELERFICAFDDPYAGAQTYLNEKSVRLKSVCLNYEDGNFHSFQSGLIFRKAKDWFCVAIKGAALIVENIYDDSGDSIFDTVRVGDRFVTPSALLERARRRPVFTPEGLK